MRKFYSKGNWYVKIDCERCEYWLMKRASTLDEARSLCGCGEE